jgi:hypothetical protein
VGSTRLQLAVREQVDEHFRDPGLSAYAAECLQCLDRHLQAQYSMRQIVRAAPVRA